jgi:hypothetical protein
MIRFSIGHSKSKTILREAESRMRYVDVYDTLL